MKILTTLLVESSVGQMACMAGLTVLSTIPYSRHQHCPLILCRSHKEPAPEEGGAQGKAGSKEDGAKHGDGKAGDGRRHRPSV